MVIKYVSHSSHWPSIHFKQIAFALFTDSAFSMWLCTPHLKQVTSLTRLHPFHSAAPNHGQQPVRSDTRINILKLILRGHFLFLFCSLEASSLREAILTMNFLGSPWGKGMRECSTRLRSTGDNQQFSEKMHHLIHFLPCNFSSYCVGPSRYLWAS